jgi:hypothetical protein
MAVISKPIRVRQVSPSDPGFQQAVDGAHDQLLLELRCVGGQRRSGRRGWRLAWARRASRRPEPPPTRAGLLCPPLPCRHLYEKYRGMYHDGTSSWADRPLLIQ